MCSLRPKPSYRAVTAGKIAGEDFLVNATDLAATKSFVPACGITENAAIDAIRLSTYIAPSAIHGIGRRKRRR